MRTRRALRALCPILTSVFVVLCCVDQGYAQSQNVVDQFESREHTFDGFTIPYRLFVPNNLDPSVEYPLILTLHGSGQRGSDNEKHISTFTIATTWADPQAQAENPVFVVSPQAPTNGRWAIASGDPGVIGRELATTIDLLDSLAIEFNIDPDRVYITGLSMGGFGVFEAVYHDPDRFAAAIPMSSGYDPSTAPALEDVPFFVFHGKQDLAVPWEFSTQMVSAFEELGRTAVYTDCDAFECSEMSVAELDSALATRPNLVYVSHPNDGHVIWDEAYASQGLYEWVFAQHRLTPDAIQFNAPSGYPSLSGMSNIEWTAPNPDDSLEVWFSPDYGQTWNLVEAGVPNTGSYNFDSAAYADTPFGIIRLMLIGEDGRVYARERSTPFQINNGSSGAPVVQLLDFIFRDQVIIDPATGALEHRRRRVVTDTSLTLRFRAGDTDSPSLDMTLLYSSDGGATFETVDAFSHGAGIDLGSFTVDMVSLANTPEAQLRLDVSDGQSTISALTPVFAKDTPRNSSSFVEPVAGNGNAVISINFVDPERLTGHRYRIDFSVTENGGGKTANQVKTYGVTDVDLGTELFSGFPVSLRESPEFDGMRLSIQDIEPGLDSTGTGWTVGDTDLDVTIEAETGVFGALLATPDDYRITMTEEVADTSQALFGFRAQPMRFVVDNVTAGEPRDVLFSDRGDGVPGFSDRMYILEEDDTGELAPAWFFTFGRSTVAPEAGDVFEMVTRKPISDGDSFEFVGTIGVGVEEDGLLSDDFRLGQNYPNPFSQATTIPYHLASAADVELTVFDALGRRVAVLVDGQQPGGDHQVDWKTARMPSGVYFYRLKAGSFRQTRSLLLLK